MVPRISLERRKISICEILRYKKNMKTVIFKYEQRIFIPLIYSKSNFSMASVKVKEF